MKARILRWLWAAVGIVAGGKPKAAPTRKPVAVAIESPYITGRRRAAIEILGENWALHPIHTRYLKKGS